MGLNNHRDRLCVVQISDGSGEAHLVTFPDKIYSAPNLKKVLGDKNITKIFHFARFDIAILKHYIGVMPAPLYCTKIASRLVRTYAESHSLKELCNELLNIQLSKKQRSSDWGIEELLREQAEYAASDVLYLHNIRDKLNHMLARENRTHLAEECFKFLPTRAELDLCGWPEIDIFTH